MASLKTIHYILFLLIAFEATRTCMSVLALRVRRSASNNGSDDIKLVSCNRNCTKNDGDHCPDGCMCIRLGDAVEGECYKFTGVNDSTVL
uniref:Evasin n=1 Tax=Rhipicephalus appendiculatus TaxID=34631 RepID=A0A131YFG6_RHIAP